MAILQIVRPRRAAYLFGVSRDFRKNRSEKGNKSSADALCYEQHLFVIDCAAGEPGGHVGYARDGQHIESHVARHNGFRHSGHTNEVGANGAEITNFRRSFITWAGKRGVNTFFQIDADLTCRILRKAAKEGAISFAEVGKARTEALVVGSVEGGCSPVN